MVGNKFGKLILILGFMAWGSSSQIFSGQNYSINAYLLGKPFEEEQPTNAQTYETAHALEKPTVETPQEEPLHHHCEILARVQNYIKVLSERFCSHKNCIHAHKRPQEGLTKTTTCILCAEYFCVMIGFSALAKNLQATNPGDIDPKLQVDFLTLSERANAFLQQPKFKHRRHPKHNLPVTKKLQPRNPCRTGCLQSHRGARN